MSREARIKDDYGIFYIYQQSGGNRHLFECDEDRKYFLKVLAKAQAKYHFKLYAYCILSPDEYHLVLDVNGGDLSKLMKSLNISYAMHIKCTDKLFKDRYKSKLLNSDNKIKEIIDTIHHRYKHESLWNSYCSYNGLVPLNLILDPYLKSKVQECPECLHTLAEAQEKLNVLLNKHNKTLTEFLNDKKNRNQTIKDFRKYSTLTLKELGEVFGGLSESSISKILNH